MTQTLAEKDTDNRLPNRMEKWSSGYPFRSMLHSYPERPKNGTFSSATDFAAMFRDYEVGKIVGYETGGIPNCFGDAYSFKLKNSGIRCNVSWKQFVCPKPRPGDDMHGVLPDVPMSVELLRAYRKDADPVLAFTLDHAKKTRGGDM